MKYTRRALVLNMTYWQRRAAVADSRLSARSNHVAIPDCRAAIACRVIAPICAALVTRPIPTANRIDGTYAEDLRRCSIH